MKLKYKLLFGLIAVIMIVPMLSGCQGSPSDIPLLPGGDILGINLSPSDIQLKSGHVTKFKATGIFPGGVTYDVTPFVDWVSSNPSVAFFLEDGTLVANTPGNTMVTAKFNGTNSQTASVMVPAAPGHDIGDGGTPSVAVLRGLRVEPTLAVITEGETFQFECFGLYSDGTERDYSTLVQWRASHPDLGFITPSGNYHSVDSFGIITVSAKFNDFESNYVLLVINEDP